MFSCNDFSEELSYERPKVVLRTQLKAVDPLVPTPQNGQAHSNNSLATADELVKHVWPFCGVSA